MSNYTKATNFAVKDSLSSGDPSKLVKGTEIDTEFSAIVSAVASKADSNNSTLTGTPVAPTAAVGTNSTQVATTAFVHAERTSTATLTNKTLTSPAISSPTITGTPIAPTATAGTNTTQVATTAFVTTAITNAVTSTLQTAYPVGSIYINATNSTNPSTLLGFGTWTAFGAGRVPVGFNASDSNFNASEKVGGSKDAIVVSHTHTASTNEAGSHNHIVSDIPVKQTDFDRGGGSSLFSADDSTTRTTSTAGAHTHSITVNSAGSSGTDANLQPYITVYMWKRLS